MNALIAATISTVILLVACDANTSDCAHTVPISAKSSTESRCEYTCKVKSLKPHHFAVYAKNSDRKGGLPDVFKSGDPNQWINTDGVVEYWQDGEIIAQHEIKTLVASGDPSTPSWSIHGATPKTKNDITIIITGDLSKLAHGRSLTCHYVE